MIEAEHLRISRILGGRVKEALGQGDLEAARVPSRQLAALTELEAERIRIFTAFSVPDVSSEQISLTEESLPDTFGEFITREREKLGLNQAEFAQRGVFISQSLISILEHGKGVSLKSLQAFRRRVLLISGCLGWERDDPRIEQLIEKYQPK